MSARLPVPNSDDGNWGTLLNTYLRVEHAEDGTLKIRSDGSLATVATSGAYNDLSGKPTIPNINDATTSGKGIIQLAGDLSGSAAAPTVPGKQPLNSDLTAIASLTTANNDFLQRKSGAWTNRTITQVKSDLSYVGSDILGSMRGARRRPHAFPMPGKVVIERWQSGHGWGVQGSSVTQASNDTTVTGLGTQSMKLTSLANSYGATRKTGYVSQDLSTKHPRICLTIENPPLWTSGSITVFCAPSGGLSSSTYHSWQINIDTTATTQQNAVMTPAGLMVWIDLPWASVFSSGSAAKTAITDWQVAVNSVNVAGLNVWLHGIEIVDNLATKYPNGVVTLCFDDSYQGQWDYARPSLAKYGYAGTLFPIISNVGQTGSLTLTQLKTFQDTFGWEVAAHATTTATHSGFAGMTQTEVLVEMQACIDWLNQNGFHSDVFAYPLGSFSPNNADFVAGQLFSGARSINPSVIGAMPPSHAYRLRSRSGVGGSGGFGVTSSDTTGTYGLLSQTKAGQGWTILTLHDITTGSSSGINSCSAADLTTLVDSIANLGLEVRTMGQVLDSIRS